MVMDNGNGAKQMAKTWHQIRNAQVIAMRRNNVRDVIELLRYYKQSGEFSKLNILSLKLKVRELFVLYRQTNKVLCRNI